MLLGTLGASLLRNLLSEKRIVRVGSVNKKGKEIVRPEIWNKKVLWKWTKIYCSFLKR